MVKPLPNKSADVLDLSRDLAIGHPTDEDRRRLTVIARGKDAIFDWSDPLPFLMVHHVHIPWLLLQNLLQRKDWMRIDFNIGKLSSRVATDR